MSSLSMRELLEAGAHFGHQTRFWSPKMSQYIFGSRNKIHIINLEKTVAKFDEAAKFLTNLAAQKGTILFVGTKRTSRDAIVAEAKRAGMPYVDQRWLGGMLTNFKTIRGRVARLAQLKAMAEVGTFDMLPKKEVAGLELEIEKLEKYLGGITEMKKIPQAMFIVDPRKERIAVSEAIKLGLPIVAIVDTNCDPDEIDYVIPGNDDAIRAVKLIAGAMANAVIEGRDGKDTADEAAEAPAAEKKPAKKPAKKADKADKAE